MFILKRVTGEFETADYRLIVKIAVIFMKIPQILTNTKKYISNLEAMAPPREDEKIPSSLNL